MKDTSLTKVKINDQKEKTKMFCGNFERWISESNTSQDDTKSYIEKSTHLIYRKDQNFQLT